MIKSWPKTIAVCALCAQPHLRGDQALALAEELAMRPPQVHCHRGLGPLYAIQKERYGLTTLHKVNGDAGGAPSALVAYCFRDYKRLGFLTKLATRDNCHKNERNGNAYQRNHEYRP